MQLDLVRTEYNMKYDNHTAKAILSCQEGKGEVQVFIDGIMSYYYVVEKIQEMAMNEVELSKYITDTMLNDRERWIRDCSLIQDHRKDFAFVNKVVIYKGFIGSKAFLLSLSAMEDEGRPIFVVNYEDTVNGDKVRFELGAKDAKELGEKVKRSAERTAIISTEFLSRIEELWDSTFPKLG